MSRALCSGGALSEEMRERVWKKKAPPSTDVLIEAITAEIKPGSEAIVQQ